MARELEAPSYWWREEEEEDEVDDEDEACMPGSCSQMISGMEPETATQPGFNGLTNSSTLRRSCQQSNVTRPLLYRFNALFYRANDVDSYTPTQQSRFCAHDALPE